MTLTPAIKGQLTKATKQMHSDEMDYDNELAFNKVRSIFIKYMPREQAKHAARKYLAQIA